MLLLGCAALAAGAIPFLRSFAAEEETAVSGSDLVSGSDAVSAFSGTVEPKPTHAAIGGMDWVRMNSIDDLSNATLSCKSNIFYQDVVNWINAGYLSEFLEANGYTEEDAGNIWFVSDYDGTDLSYTSRGVLSRIAPPSNFNGKIIYYLPRKPHTSFTVSHEHVNLNVGDEFQFSAELEPDTTNDKILWRSSNTSVVTITSQGLITAVGYGEAVITATAYDETKTITVNVSGGSPVTNINTSAWVKADSWDDLKNASFVPKRLLPIAKLIFLEINGEMALNLTLICKYNPDNNTATRIKLVSNKLQYVEITEEDLASNDKVYYIPATSVHTFHPAEPANCVHLATIGYWEDPDGNLSLHANGDDPIDSIYDETSTLADHTLAWVTDTAATCGADGVKHEECSVCHAKQNENTVIPATGEHTYAWVTDTPATCGADGVKHEECSVCHAKQNEHTEIPARGADDYSFTPDSAFRWKQGSTDGLKMVIKNTSGDDTATYGKFLDVYVDGEKLTRDTDYTAEPGSIEITLSVDYLNSLSVGEHTLKVELTVTSIEHTFTVTASGGSDSPDTGESAAAIILCLRSCSSRHTARCMRSGDLLLAVSRQRLAFKKMSEEKVLRDGACSSLFLFFRFSVFRFMAQYRFSP